MLFRSDLSQAQTDGKMILLCFFDFQQRPSRRALALLARDAEMFKDKSVVVLAVETSGDERRQLDEWMQQSDVPSAVGVIEGAFDEKRLTWGVKSLPWLVLADKDHVVRAEGFGLDEVSERIAAIE